MRPTCFAVSMAIEETAAYFSMGGGPDDAPTGYELTWFGCCIEDHDNVIWSRLGDHENWAFVTCEGDDGTIETFGYGRPSLACRPLLNVDVKYSLPRIPTPEASHASRVKYRLHVYAMRDLKAADSIGHRASDRVWLPSFHGQSLGY